MRIPASLPRTGSPLAAGSNVAPSDFAIDPATGEGHVVFAGALAAGGEQGVHVQSFRIEHAFLETWNDAVTLEAGTSRSKPTRHVNELAEFWIVYR